MAASGHSSDFNAFYESFFGDPYMAWHDGLDTGSLERLQGAEREQAEKLLIDALDSGDYRPAAGLAVLRSEKALSKLKEQLRTTRGDQAIQTARALWHTGKYPPAVGVVIDILLHDPFWGTRLNAAIALREMKTTASVAALWNAVTDPEDLVRHHAATSLLVMYGLQDESTGEDNPLTIDIMSDDKPQQNKAISTLKTLVQDHGKLTLDP